MTNTVATGISFQKSLQVREQPLEWCLKSLNYTLIEWSCFAPKHKARVEETESAKHSCHISGFYPSLTSSAREHHLVEYVVFKLHFKSRLPASPANIRLGRSGDTLVNFSGFHPSLKFSRNNS